MKKVILFVVTILGSTSYAWDTHVNGYTRSNGTYVQPHYRSASDSSTDNNWSTRGNTNPHTGQEGTRSYGNDSYGGSYGTSGSSNRNNGYGQGSSYNYND